MQILKSTVPQPRYVPRAQVEGQPNALMMLMQGRYRGCNYAIVCTGEYPIGMVQIDRPPESLPEISKKGLQESIGHYCDTMYVEDVVKPEGEEANTTIVKFSFNTGRDWSVADSNSPDENVRKANEDKVKWTTEDVVHELFMFIDGLDLN